MRKIRKTVITLAVWFGIQVLVSLIGVFAALIKGEAVTSILAPALLVSDFVVIVVLLILRYCRFKDLFKTIPADVFLISVAMGLCTMFAVDLLAQPIDLPNLLEEQFQQMSRSWTGFLGICIIGPIMEEMMMRRVILKEMRKLTHSMWWGIIISAAIFSVIHVNPVQVVFAMPAGIVLGWLYCKTGTLLVPICIHILNNSFSFITMRMESETEIELSSPIGMLLLTVALLVSIGTTVWLVRYFARSNQADIQKEPAAQTEQTGSKGAFSGNNYEK